MNWIVAALLEKKKINGLEKLKINHKKHRTMGKKIQLKGKI